MGSQAESSGCVAQNVAQEGNAGEGGIASQRHGVLRDQQGRRKGGGLMGGGRHGDPVGGQDAAPFQAPGLSKPAGRSPLSAPLLCGCVQGLARGAAWSGPVARTFPILPLLLHSGSRHKGIHKREASRLGALEGGWGDCGDSPRAPRSLVCTGLDPISGLLCGEWAEELAASRVSTGAWRSPPGKAETLPNTGAVELGEWSLRPRLDWPKGEGALDLPGDEEPSLPVLGCALPACPWPPPGACRVSVHPGLQA